MSDTESENENETPAAPDEDAPITEEQVQEAEAEEQTDETPSVDDDVIETAQQQFDERAAEAGRKRIDRAVTSLVKALTEVLADEAQYLEPCPRCASDFPGMVWKPSVKQVLPEQRAAVMISMGEDPDPTLKQDPRASTCDRCDGYGKVSTGSKVARQDKLECEECKGRGWVGPRAATLPTLTLTPDMTPFPPADSNGHESPPTDPWGRVKGEPLYGVMPGFEQ